MTRESSHQPEPGARPSHDLAAEVAAYLRTPHAAERLRTVAQHEAFVHLVLSPLMAGTHARCRLVATALAALAAHEDGTPHDTDDYDHAARVAVPIDELLIGEARAISAGVQP